MRVIVPPAPRFCRRWPLGGPALTTALGTALALVACPALPLLPMQAQQAPASARPGPEPEAVGILRRMGTYLNGLSSFSVNAEISEDILFSSGQKLQFGRSVSALVRRPDRLRVVSAGDLATAELVFDGRTMTLLDRDRNRYASFASPAGIDAALPDAARRFDLRAPLADLLYTDADRKLLSGTVSGGVVGSARLQGRRCDHLAFRQKEIDWQIWVEQGARPLPCKLVITDRREKEGLQFTALFSDWNAAAPTPDEAFSFRVPAGATPVTLPAAAAGAPAGVPRRGP